MLHRSRLSRSLAVLLPLVLTACGDGTPVETTSAPANAHSPAAAGEVHTDLSSRGTPAPDSPCNLTMGWDPWEPYQGRSVHGDVEGLDIELVSALMTEAGCVVGFEEGRWATLLRKLQRGTVDLLTGATRTPARESFALFSEPYRSESFVLFVRAGETARYASDDLGTLLANGFRVGVTEQYVYGSLITDLQEDPRYADQFVGATVGELNYARLLDLEIDGFLEDPFVAATILRRKGLNADIEAHPLEISSGDVRLMFSKASTSPAIVARIDAALAALKIDGRYQAIIDKYRR